jgi:hypothetical protein
MFGSQAQSVPQSDPAEAPQQAESSSCKKVLAVLFIIGNIFFSVLAATCGALGIKGSSSVSDTSVVFVGLYIILFAAILVGYEISQYTPGRLLDNIVKKNLGFLYGPIGRSAYIIL